MTTYLKLIIRTLLFALFMIAPGRVAAQIAAPLMHSCEIFKEINENHQSESFTLSEALTLVDAMLESIGLSRNFQIVAAHGTNNAEAMMRRGENGAKIEERLLIYDPKWARRQFDESRWSFLAILAHQAGHHLQGHTLDCMGSTPLKEIEADRFAGNVLARLGASQAQAIEMWKQLHEEGTETHPSRLQRIAAVREGWERGVRGEYPYEFRLSGFSSKNCINIEVATRRYIADIDEDGMLGAVQSVLDNRSTVVRRGDAIISSVGFHLKIVDRRLTLQGVKNRVYRTAFNIIDHYFENSALVVSIASARRNGHISRRGILEFWKDGTYRETILHISQEVGGRHARVSESQRTYRDCEYTGAPAFWQS